MSVLNQGYEMELPVKWKCSVFALPVREPLVLADATEKDF